MAAKKKDLKEIKVSEGEVETLTQEEQKIIDDSVFFINEKWNSSCRNLIEIGNLLLKNFYNDDIDLARARGRRKEGISLRKLAIRPDLNVSIATLSRSFNLAAQEKFLVKVNSPQLTDSHKILLLHIEDPKVKVSYAKKIISGSISCRDFTKILIKDGFMRQRGLSAGRKKQLQSNVSDPFNPFLAPLESISSFEFDKFDFTNLNLTKSKDFLESVKKAKSVLDKLLESLENVI